MNCLDIATINALVIWQCEEDPCCNARKFSSFSENWTCS